jgi:hypothetical protein
LGHVTDGNGQSLTTVFRSPRLTKSQCNWFVNVGKHRTQIIFKSCHLPLEKAVQEKKGIKNENRMRMGAKLFSKFEDF